MVPPSWGQVQVQEGAYHGDQMEEVACLSVYIYSVCVRVRERNDAVITTWFKYSQRMSGHCLGATTERFHMLDNIVLS